MKLRVDGFDFIAVSYGPGAVTTNFEQSDHFWLFYLMDGKIKRKELLSSFSKTNDERLASIGDSMIDVLICRNYGPRSMAKLREQKVAIYTFDGGCDAAIKAYLSGDLRRL